MDSVAIPPLRVALPRAVVPSLIVTVPVVVAGETFAVSVMPLPTVDGLAEEVNVVVVGAAADAALTACVKTGEMLAGSFVSPAYTAESECEPAASVDVDSVAVPLIKVAVPMTLCPSPNVTVPVAVEGTTAAVSVTLRPVVEGLADDVTAMLL